MNKTEVTTDVMANAIREAKKENNWQAIADVFEGIDIYNDERIQQNFALCEEYAYAHSHLSEYQNDCKDKKLLAQIFEDLYKQFNLSAKAFDYCVQIANTSREKITSLFGVAYLHHNFLQSLENYNKKKLDDTIRRYFINKILESSAEVLKLEPEHYQSHYIIAYNYNKYRLFIGADWQSIAEYHLNLATDMLSRQNPNNAKVRRYFEKVHYLCAKMLMDDDHGKNFYTLSGLSCASPLNCFVYTCDEMRLHIKRTLDKVYQSVFCFDQTPDHRNFVNRVAEINKINCGDSIKDYSERIYCYGNAILDHVINMRICNYVTKPSSIATAEACFKKSMELAKQQGCHDSYIRERYARLCCIEGRFEDALALISPNEKVNYILLTRAYACTMLERYDEAYDAIAKILRGGCPSKGNYYCDRVALTYLYNHLRMKHNTTASA